MSTRFEYVTTYAAPPSEVLAMLTDPRFREEACEAQGALDHEVSITAPGVGAVVDVRRTLSTEGALAAATKLIGSSVEIVQHEEWVSEDKADLTLEIPGKPGRLEGTIELVAGDDGTTEQRVTGEVTVKVPLVAGKLEQLITKVLGSALKREGRAGEEWLADSRR
jgi:hypothetical protein